jgi:hypothetical protein
MQNTFSTFQIARVLLVASLVFPFLGCEEKEDSKPAVQAQEPPRYLYVASGLCYSANTTFTNTTSSNLIYRLNLDTGARDMLLADFNSSPAQNGDSPVGIGRADENTIYALIENTTTVGARRLERIEKRQMGARSTFSNNTTAMSAVLRSLVVLPNGDLVISKSSAIEKITSANIRIQQGANPFASAPGGACATSTTLVSKVVPLGNGNLVYLHAAASQNRFGIISAAGYATVADCKAAQSAPVPTAFPVTATYDSAAKRLLVAYAGTTVATDVNSIYSYLIDESTNAISDPQKIYDANLYPATYPYLLYGISEMVLDEKTQSLYVATAVNTATTVVNYAIEKFSYSTSKTGIDNTKVLTRVGSTPFYPYGIDTKCISSLFIGN